MGDILDVHTIKEKTTKKNYYEKSNSLRPNSGQKRLNARH